MKQKEFYTNIFLTFVLLFCILQKRFGDSLGHQSTKTSHAESKIEMIDTAIFSRTRIHLNC